MSSLASRRRAFPTLTAIAAAAALAGCGGDDGSTAGAGEQGPAAAGVDARALLKDSFLQVSNAGEPITAGAFDIKISGKVDAPKDTDLRHLEGKVALKVAVDPGKEGALLPPFALTFDVDGNYADDKGKEGTGAYKGGVSYIGDTFFARWDDVDYAVGDELSKQALAEVEKADKETGGNGDGGLGGQDPQKILDAMELDAGSWIKDPKAEEGGTLDGVDTYKVTGAVDPSVVVDDVTEGLRKLPEAVPDLPGVKELADLSDTSTKDVKAVEDAITKLDLTVWVGKDDKIQRRMTLDLAFKEDESGTPTDAQILLDVSSSKLNQDQGLVAPKSTQPITDLILKLEKQFSGLFGGGSIA